MPACCIQRCCSDNGAVKRENRHRSKSSLPPQWLETAARRSDLRSLSDFAVKLDSIPHGCHVRLSETFPSFFFVARTEDLRYRQELFETRFERERRKRFRAYLSTRKLPATASGEGERGQLGGEAPSPQADPQHSHSAGSRVSSALASLAARPSSPLKHIIDLVLRGKSISNGPVVRSCPLVSRTSSERLHDL